MKGVQDALTRLSGVKKVTVKLQDGLVITETDDSQAVLPRALWKEIARVGFTPVRMELRARGALEEAAFVIDGRRWSLSRPSGERGPRTARLRIEEGACDPPRVEVLE